jgi:3' terminal RNA ribose 2'-O-methyltransferase Hen1
MGSIVNSASLATTHPIIMLLTITTTHQPATDLGYLLHKHPDRYQTFPLAWGTAQVFYPEASIEKCTAALILDIDPVELVRGKQAHTLDQYVNDRPYVASSFLSVAISNVYGTALNGKCPNRPELVDTAIPLSATISAVPCRGGVSFLHRLFEPLGYTLTIEGYPLDEEFPDWGTSPYYTLTISGTVKLVDLLNHIYVLIPVLDNDKHYWVDTEEVDKLLRHGEGWLAEHPEKTAIAHRYLKRQGKLAKSALAQLSIEEDPHPDDTETSQNNAEASLEQPLSLNQHRLETIVQTLKTANAQTVVDLGCGEGKLIRLLVADNSFQEILGVDVSHRALEIARERLEYKFSSPKQRERVQLVQGGLTYRDRRISGYDAAVAIEVIEHLDPDRLPAFERVLFEFAHPQTAIVTTPNVEYNVRFPNLPAGKFRHQDHRFEWTRTEFQTWAVGVANRFSYGVEFDSIGTLDPEVGAPTQMAVFTVS